MQTRISQTPGATTEVTEATGPDPLAEIDELMRKRLGDQRDAADESAQLSADRSEFSAEFTRVCQEQVRPAMEAIVERLRRNGGSGLIEEHPADYRYPNDRLVLWMSLHGEIVGSPRQDRHPYLQLDADVSSRAVAVAEGDMWAGHGGNRSGKVTEWQLSEITASRVTEEVLAILRRAFR